MNLACLTILIFLAVSVTCQDLGHQALWEADQNAQLHLCGRHLNEALKLVCSGSYRGYDQSRVPSYSDVDPSYFSKMTNKENKVGFFPDDNPDNLLSGNLYHPRFRRTIVYECCVRPCSYTDLRGYCYQFNH